MSLRLLLSILLIALMGCPEPTTPVGDDDDDTPGPVWEELIFSLDAATSQAGVSLGYTAEIVADDGTREAATVVLSSDLEPTISANGEALTATIAGSHVVTAAWTDGDTSLTASGNLEVMAGETAEIDLVLDEAIINAGDWIGFAVIPYDAYGNLTTDMGADLSADGGGVNFSGRSLRATVPGDWMVTATLGSLTDSESLRVEAALPARIELVLDDGTATVGTSVGYSTAVFDAFDNPLPDATVEVTSDGPVDVSGGLLSSTTAGEHRIIATATEGSDVWQEAWLTFEPGQAVDLTVAVSPTSPEVGDTALLTATALDSYGNAFTDGVIVTVSGLDGADGSSVTVGPDTLFFEAEGRFNVQASISPPGLTVSTEVVVDSYGPTIDTGLERGTWTTSSSTMLSGSVSDLSSVVSLSIDGTPVPMDSEGDFDHLLTHEFGVNTVETLSTDGDGNTRRDVRAVLSGDFVPRGGAASSGLVVRVNQSGLDTLETIGEDLVAGADLAALIPSPVVDEESESCAWSVCFTWYALTLWATNPRFGEADLQLVPRSDGSIRTTFTIRDVSVDWNADAVVAEVGFSGDGDISASSISVAMDVRPNIVGGEVQAGVTNINVSSTGFDFDYDSWLYDAATFFGIDVDGIVQGYVIDALETVVRDQVPGQLEELLQGLELATDFEIYEGFYDFLATPEWVSVDGSGLSVGLSTRFEPRTWVMSRIGLGSLDAGYSSPGFSASPAMVAGISLDFLNQAFYGFWGGGLLDLQLTSEDLGLEPEDLEGVGAILSEVLIEVDAYLPPVVTPTTGSGMADLAIGDLQVSLFTGSAAEENLLLRFFTTVSGSLDVGITTDSTLTATLSELGGSMDLVAPEVLASEALELEELLEGLIDALVPLLSDAIGEIPIPEFEGFALTVDGIDVAGSEGGFVHAAGNLSTL